MPPTKRVRKGTLIFVNRGEDAISTGRELLSLAPNGEWEDHGHPD
jgi:hypothetical protein